MEKRNIVLHIDTAYADKISVAVEIDGKRYQRISRSKEGKAQMVLLLIDKLLKEHQLSLNDLTSIEVNPGPGSFTGLRVGIAVANTLGWSLSIPVNGQLGKLALPRYQKSVWTPGR